MIEYQTSDTAPHLLVRLSGAITEAEVKSSFADLQDHLQSLPSGYVALVSCTDPAYLTPPALGPLYYHAVKAADTNPGLTILAYGDHDPSPDLSAFLRRLVPGNRVRVISSENEARALLQDHDA
jgi:hypothetical protein